MEDSFRVRVDKIFGSLAGGVTSSTAADNSSFWSLTNEEIERQQWNRSNNQEEDDDDESGPVVLQGPLETDLQALSEEDERDEIDSEKKRADDEDWDVKANIGRDCTLDYEEEEDEYDKVAVGIEEQTGDRLYMKDIKFADYGIDELNTCDELPDSLHTVAKDPRANHAAAIITLKEDEQVSGNPKTSHLSDNSMVTSMETEEVKKRVLDSDIRNPKSILKKGNSRSQKRVRFMCDPNSSSADEVQQLSKNGGAVQENVSAISQYAPGIPDYVRNPSKYTCYAFDTSEDLDDQSNKNAFMDLFQYLKKRNADNSSLDDTPSDSPKSVTFTPKTKPEDATMVKMKENDDTKDNIKNKGWSIGVTAEGAQESEASAMEEDELVIKGSSLQKPSRQYRARTTNIDYNLT